MPRDVLIQRKFNSSGPPDRSRSVWKVGLVINLSGHAYWRIVQAELLPPGFLVQDYHPYLAPSSEHNRVRCCSKLFKGCFI